MKKLPMLMTLALIGALIFTGCSAITNILDPLPDEYVDGLRIPRDYPDDDLEIYDDAIVYEVDEDDDEITLEYGTTDEIDDVIDFYEDLFDDKELTIEEQEDDRDEFSANGKGKGFKFEISAEEPRGEYEARAFATIVKVEVEFVEVGADTLEKLQGFWLICGTEGVLSDDVRAEGLGIDFKGITMDFYAQFEEDTFNIPFTFVDDDTINYTEDGDEYTVDISFENIDGIDILSMYNDGITINLEKSSYDTMMSYKPADTPVVQTVDLNDNLSDADLEYWISDINWNYLGYVYPDKSFEQATASNRMLFNSDYSGEDEDSGSNQSISWYVYESSLFITYPDGNEYYWPIDFEYDGTLAYLYLYDIEEGYEGGYWLYEPLQ